MDLRARLQSLLDADYVVERELGGGGMSRVFVATERRLGRRVVIKVCSTTRRASAVGNPTEDSSECPERRRGHAAPSPVYAATAAGAGPASTRRFETGSIVTLSPSSERKTSSTRSCASPNTMSSTVTVPAAARVFEFDVDPEDAYLIGHGNSSAAKGITIALPPGAIGRRSSRLEGVRNL